MLLTTGISHDTLPSELSDGRKQLTECIDLIRHSCLSDLYQVGVATIMGQYHGTVAGLQNSMGRMWTGIDISQLQQSARTNKI